MEEKKAIMARKKNAMTYYECNYEALNLFAQNQELNLIAFITYNKHYRPDHM